MTGGIGSARAPLGGATCGGMFRLAQLIAIVGTTAAAAGCAAPATAPDQDTPDTIVVETSALHVSSTHGLLRDAVGAPVAGARVEVHPASGAAIVACVTTTSDGAFTLKVRPASYDIVVKPRAGFSPQRFPAQQVGSDTLELRLAVAMELTTTPVSGRLVDQNGNPITAGGLEVCGNFGCVTPGTDGGFVVNVVVGQPPRLQVNGWNAPGGATGKFQLSITSEIADGSVGDLVLPLFTFTVQVVAADGAPVTGATLISTSCYPVTADGLAGQFCLAVPSPDAGGRFHLVVPPGTVPLQVPGALGPRVEVPVTGDTDYTLTLPATVRLTGLITASDGTPQDGAMTGAQVCVRIPGCASKFCPPNCTMTDGAGRYQLNAAAGDYEVDVSSTPAFGGYSLSQTLSLSGSQELNLTLPKQLLLTGHVLDGNDAPVPAATVFGACYPIAVDGFTGAACPGEQLSDGDGAFAFTLAAPGTTTLEVKGADATAQSVTVGTDSDVNVRFAAPALLAGQLLTGDSGVPGAYLCFLEESVFNLSCVTTDPNGQFQLSLLPSTYHVFTETNRNNTFLSVDYPHFTVSSAPIILRTPPLQQLAGRLVGLGGQPLVGAPVYVICQRATSDDLAVEFCGSADLTDAGGGFSFLSLEGSQQDLAFQPPQDSGAPWVTVDDVTAGGSATFVTVALQPAPAASPAPTTRM